jgi:DNA repair protein RecO (recombination protein O)
MIARTEAVILRSLKYGETSKILHLYTRSFGRLSVMAKGARGKNSRFGATLEPMNIVSAVLYKHEHRDIHLLSQCDSIVSLRRLTEDLDRMAVGLSAVSLVHTISHGEERNEALFSSLVETLQAANDATNSPIPALYFFEVRLLEILGFRPDFHICQACSAPVGRPEGEGTPDSTCGLDYGGGLCSACTREGHAVRNVSIQTVKVLQWLQNCPSAVHALHLSLAAHQKQEIGESLRLFLRHHVEGFRDPKSEHVFSSILGS